jgi:CheY-like chemotaxis protein
MVERMRAQGAARRVLVVEDNDDARELVRVLVEAEGYEVECAENGKEALERIHASVPAFILLDLMMPVMSGWELLEILNQDPRLAAIPVAILSATHDVSDEVRRGRLYLAKPLRPEALVSLVAELAAMAGSPLALAV